MSDILKEIEDSWGVQRELWDLEQWKKAATLSAKSYDHLANLTDDLIQGTDEARFKADALIKLLQERLEKSEARNTKLTKWLHKFIKKPVGRPFKTRQSKPFTFKTLNDLYQPPKRKGRPNDYQHEYKEQLIAFIDSIKNEQNLKTDIAAIRHFCRDIPARQRQSETNKCAKLLNRFRKEIEKLRK